VLRSRGPGCASGEERVAHGERRDTCSRGYARRWRTRGCLCPIRITRRSLREVLTPLVSPGKHRSEQPSLRQADVTSRATREGPETDRQWRLVIGWLRAWIWSVASFGRMEYNSNALMAGDLPDIPRARGGFTWQKVDLDLIEALLAETGRVPSARIRRGLKRSPNRPAALRRTADEVLGRGQRSLEPLAHVLRDKWLVNVAPPSSIAKIARDVEEQLGVAGSSRIDEAGRQREFLSKLRPGSAGWDTFTRSLVREFRNAHRRDLGPRASRRRRTDGFEVLSDLELRGSAASGRLADVSFDDQRPYQREAWKRLDALAAKRQPIRGFIQLPTGAGKTDVAVRWIVGQLAKVSLPGFHGDLATRISSSGKEPVSYVTSEEVPR